MNMNFIAFSSLAKLLDRPHLDAAAAGHGDLDKIYQADGLQNPPAAGFVAADTSLSFRGGRNRQCPRARSRASVVLASAVTMRIGIERVRVSSFRRRMTSRPFMPGIAGSRTMMSGRS